MTTLVVLQPSYFPWLGYFDQMNKADVFVWYDDVQFDKNGWRNRNRIKGLNGPLWLSVPVLHSGRARQLICDVEIDNRQPWRRKHLTSISQMYATAPFVDDVLPRLRVVLGQTWDKLVDLDIATIDCLAEMLEINTPRHRSSSLGIGGDRNERLLNLCEYFGAKRYLSGDAAKVYLDVDLFRRRGIEVVWHGYQHPHYAQLHGMYVPYLSALDLVLNEGPASRRILTS